MAKPVKPKQPEKPKQIKGKVGGARPGAGRPEFVPTDEERRQVEALSGYGLPQEQIAILIRGGINLSTLREHFATELVAGKAKANGQIGKTLFQKAMGGDTAAMIWWSKAQMRWAETQKHEHTGADGGEMVIKTIQRTVVKNDK
jgi:hypothetical protein